MDQLKNALADSTSNEDFKAKYGHDKPSKSDGIVTSCMAGRRAEKAMKIAEGEGYTKYIEYFICFIHQTINCYCFVALNSMRVRGQIGQRRKAWPNNLINVILYLFGIQLLSVKVLMSFILYNKYGRD